MFRVIGGVVVYGFALYGVTKFMERYNAVKSGMSPSNLQTEASQMGSDADGFVGNADKLDESAAPVGA